MQENAIGENAKTAIQPYKSFAFDQFLTYSALGGLVINDDGKIEKMTVAQFCGRVGVDTATTWRWKQIPDFAMRVRERRQQVVPLARETAAFNQLFMLGMQTQDKRAAVDALKSYLGHFSDLQLPTQKQEVKFEGNFLDMMAAAAREGIIEGEIVDADQLGPQADTGRSDQDPGALPPAS